MVFVLGDKIIHRTVGMRFLPLCVQMVHIHSTGAPAKDAEKCMVGHMSGDATQRRALEATFGVGGVNRQQTNCSTG